MSWIMVDVEADGPIPGDYSMVSIGAVKVEPSLSKTFYAELKPISEKWVPEALSVCHFTREQTESFENPHDTMQRFALWLEKECGSHLFFISDNSGFDWQFTNWYFHHFLGVNPFGFGSTDLLSLYNGLVKDMYQNFKHLRKTVHSHNALQDALGNAEALLQLHEKLNLKINW